MKATCFLGALATVASSVSAQTYNQSLPFDLIIQSANASLDGKAFYPCHEGAAIEGFCVGVPGSKYFQFNTTEYPTTFDPAIGKPGIITYLLRGGNFNLSSPMSFTYNPANNYAVPLLQPSYANQQVSFNTENVLLVGQYNIDAGKTISYNRWYVCETYSGYRYTTLVWGLGSGLPENPTCQKVSVIRQF